MTARDPRSSIVDSTLLAVAILIACGAMYALVARLALDGVDRTVAVRSGLDLAAAELGRARERLSLVHPTRELTAARARLIRPHHACG